MAVIAGTSANAARRISMEGLFVMNRRALALHLKSEYGDSHYAQNPEVAMIAWRDAAINEGVVGRYFTVNHLDRPGRSLKLHRHVIEVANAGRRARPERKIELLRTRLQHELRREHSPAGIVRRRGRSWARRIA